MSFYFYAVIYLSKPKKSVYPKTALIFEDEASFRQDSTLHSTWAHQGCQSEVPVTRQRKNAKALIWLEVHNLPPYSPEFNAVKRRWHHTRMTGTHNRYFSTEQELASTLRSLFRKMQRSPEQIKDL